MNTRYKHFLAFSLPLLFFVFSDMTALAAVAAAPASMYTNPILATLNVKTVPQLLLALVDLVFLIAVPIIVICIIYSGFLFVVAGDNESQIAKARTVFTWTVIGAGVLLGAKGIELAIQSTICSLDPTYTSFFCT